MKLKLVVVDLETPGWLKKVLAIGAPVIAIAASGVVFATPKLFKNNTALSADDLNAMNTITVGTVTISVGATHFCGVGPNKTAGAVNFNNKYGYAGVKAMCQASVACGQSPTAHMCDASEVVRSLQLGQTLPTGWYSSGLYAATNGTGGRAWDCYSWGGSLPADSGALFSASLGGVSSATCDTMQDVLCCD